MTPELIMKNIYPWKILTPKKYTFFTQDFKVLGVNINSKNSELYINQKKVIVIEYYFTLKHKTKSNYYRLKFICLGNAPPA